jgi:hypothetical protein
MTTTGTQTNSANHELSASQSLRMINPSMSMNRNVAMLQKNNQPTIRFSDFGIFFTILFRELHKSIQQLQADLLIFVRVKLHGANCASAKSKARPHHAAIHAQSRAVRGRRQRAANIDNEIRDFFGGGKTFEQ